MSILVVILTLLSSFLITFLLMPSLIRYFRAKKKDSRFGKKVRPGMLKSRDADNGRAFVYHCRFGNLLVGCSLARSLNQYDVGFAVCFGGLWIDWHVG